jgi:hypothetical protein
MWLEILKGDYRKLSPDELDELDQIAPFTEKNSNP